MLDALVVIAEWDLREVIASPVDVERFLLRLASGNPRGLGFGH